MPNFLSGPAAEVRQGLMEAGSAASATVGGDPPAQEAFLSAVIRPMLAIHDRASELGSEAVVRRTDGHKANSLPVTFASGNVHTHPRGVRRISRAPRSTARRKLHLRPGRPRCCVWILRENSGTSLSAPDLSTSAPRI